MATAGASATPRAASRGLVRFRVSVARRPASTRARRFVVAPRRGFVSPIASNAADPRALGGSSSSSYALPGSSSPVTGLVDAEPFSLGLRRDADAALELGEPLGRGAMGVVRRATRRSDGRAFALKTIPKAGPASLEGREGTRDAASAWERKVRDEVNLHFALGPSLDIVTLHDAFEDEAGVHLLIDLCDGGDLLTGAGDAHAAGEDRGDRGDDDGTPLPATATATATAPSAPSVPSEASAAPMIRGMLRALAACHEHGVVHRDVKPANFLFATDPSRPTRPPRVKLSDFGLAARLSRRNGYRLTERCGTYAYLSPEMARGRSYDFKVDAWAAGVVSYVLLTGKMPFADWNAEREGRDATREGLMREIRRGRPGTPIEALPLSPGAKSLLSALLTPDPERRMSCTAAAEHYWVRENGVAKTSDALATAVVERLQAFGTLGAVRRASVRAAFDAANAGSFEKLVDDEATRRLVEAVDEAAKRACDERGVDAEECVPKGFSVEDERAANDDAVFSGGVRADALELALRDHGAELAPEEWLSLIRPVIGNNRRRRRRERGGAESDEAADDDEESRGGSAFVENAALAAIFAVPPPESGSGVSDPTREEDADASTGFDWIDGGGFDWDAIARASFDRILRKARRDPKGADPTLADDVTATARSPSDENETAPPPAVAAAAASVTFEEVAEEVCAWDGSEELCRATLREEFDAVDENKDGRLDIAGWTDLVWSEGLMDRSGRVGSACGAEAPAPDPRGPRNAGVGGEGCELAPARDAPHRPPTAEEDSGATMTPRERARAAAEARKRMARDRAARRAARRGPE